MIPSERGVTTTPIECRHSALKPSHTPRAVAVLMALGLTMAALALPAVSSADVPVCTTAVLRSPDMFNCLPGPDGSVPLATGPASTYADPAARAAFPTVWHQFGFDQRHDPVFPGNAYTAGVFWAAPLTGGDMLRAREAQATFENPESASARTGQSIGGVMGVSVAQGIVYAQIGRREINALDALTGERIWRAGLVNFAGMGQSVVHDVGGRPVVFVPVGDQAYNIYNTVDFANGEEHDRGGSFGALYAFDGLSGAQLWRVDTRGSARPTPVYRGGVLHLATGGGQLLMLDPATGAQLGAFDNPGGGHSGLAAPNWYETPEGRRYIVYGITRPALIVAVDVTDPAAPTLAWQLAPPNVAANSPGDTPVAVDPDLGLVVTTVFSTIAGQPHLIAYGIDAASGALRWSRDLGAGDSPPGFKASVPMIEAGNVYVGNTINQTFWSLAAADGSVRWSTPLMLSEPGVVRPRAAAALHTTPDGRQVLIHAAGSHIRTLDPDSGAILNDFRTLGVFSVFGAAQPAIVGNQLYLSSISGWVFAAPVDYVTGTPGYTGPPPPTDAPPVAAVFDPRAVPGRAAVAAAARAFLYYAGGADNNAFMPQGGPARDWRTPLRDALPLDAPPRDVELYGPDIATQMTHWEFGVGSGIAVAQGMVYAGSNRYAIYGLNAETGERVWRFDTLNRNFGQPVVTPTTVVVGGGDPHFDLGATGQYRARSPATEVGAQLHYVTGLDPRTGREKWTAWTDTGTSTQTPLYHAGNVYWVTGQGKVYAVNADSGAPVAPFMDERGRPRLRLPGFNAVSSPKLYVQDGNRHGRGHVERALMIVGLAMPARLVAIDLADASIAWTQPVAPDVFDNGFAATTVAVDQRAGRVIGSVLSEVDPDAQTASLLAFALDARSGALQWTQRIGRGAYPEGFVAATPVLSRRGFAFFASPLAGEVLAVDTATGTVQWRTVVEMPAGRPSWGPGVVVGNDARRLIQPVGADLWCFDAASGHVLDRRHVGGTFLYNNPVVAGATLYIGNAWGWVIALPVHTASGCFGAAAAFAEQPRSVMSRTSMPHATR